MTKLKTKRIELGSYHFAHKGKKYAVVNYRPKVWGLIEIVNDKKLYDTNLDFSTKKEALAYVSTI